MAKKDKTSALSGKEMRAIETNAQYFGISLLQLMENAGRGVAEEIATRCKKDKRIVFFCGLGGNGGDGFVAARHLLSMGFNSTVVVAGLGNAIVHEASMKNFAALKPLSAIPIIEVSDSSAIPTVEANVVVDALLGTGSKGKLKPPVLQLVDHVNSLSGLKIAIDVPTGVDSDTGETFGPAFKADVTVTFHAEKKGLAKAKKYVGELIVKDIGLPRQLETLAGPGDVFLVAVKRDPNAHKGDFGKLLVVGGNEIFSGAPTLVSMAALRTGADLVYLAAPSKTASAISSMSPDLITVKLDGNHLKAGNLKELESYIAMVNAVVLGPGIGLHPDTKEFVIDCIDAIEKAGKPLVLDADGLKAFAEFKRPLKVPVVLTPHAGEYAVLAGQKLPELIEERVKYVQKTASNLNAVILAKGKIDLICSENRFKLGLTGNPGMTVGGTGDVLSGIVGTFLAQRADAFEAAVAGAFINGAAGDFVVDKIGHHMLASDLIEWIPQIVDNPMSHAKVRTQFGAIG